MTQQIETPEGARLLRLLKSDPANIDYYLGHMPATMGALPFAAFVNLFINPFDPEAALKGWRATALQQEMADTFDQYGRICLMAPREHLKTSTVMQYLVRILYTRTYPLEINYYHLSKQIAGEKFKRMCRYIEANPLLAARIPLKAAKSDTQSYLELEDGTVLQPMAWNSGSVGKHPHIIVLDDVIDRRVIYSDDRNQKSIDRFYSDIYPQISKDDPDKKIIIIGTAQREDDLYSNLPSDFHKRVYKAILDDGTPLSPDLFTIEQLLHIKAAISESRGEKYWLKEYMNTPFDAKGDIIKAEWLKVVPHAPKGLAIYQGWDLSVGKDVEQGDWTVGATIGTKTVEQLLYIYILDIYRRRIDFDARLRAVVEQANKWHPLKIAIEDNVFQYDTVQTLTKQTTLPIEGVRTIKNKIEKFSVDLAPHFEAGKVFLCADISAPAQEADDGRTGLEVLRGELLSLPFGKFDDQADAVTMAIKASGLVVADPIIDFL